MPTVGRVLHEKSGKHSNDAERKAKIREGGHQPDGPHEFAGHRRGNERTCTKATDGNAGDQAAAVGKPLNEDGYRDDITQAQAGASDDAIAEIEQPQFMGGKARQKDTATPKKTGYDRDGSGAKPIQPKPAERGRAAKEEPADVERERNLSDAPSELLHQRDAKHTPCVSGTQGHLQADASGCDPPSID